MPISRTYRLSGPQDLRDAAKPGDVITYQLSPEELERIRALPMPGGKQPRAWNFEPRKKTGQTTSGGWPASDSVLRQLIADGLKDREIAEKYGVTLKAVQNRVWKLGIKRRDLKQTAKQEVEPKMPRNTALVKEPEPVKPTTPAEPVIVTESNPLLQGIIADMSKSLIIIDDVGQARYLGDEIARMIDEHCQTWLGKKISIRVDVA